MTPTNDIVAQIRALAKRVPAQSDADLLYATADRIGLLQDLAHGAHSAIKQWHDLTPGERWAKGEWLREAKAIDALSGPCRLG